MMAKKKLAICIPTYKQPEMMNEMLVRCLDFYEKNEVDLYIYDSSPDNKTEDIVMSYNVGDHHINYKHMEKSIQSNVKALNGLKEIYEEDLYEYLWICPDYFQLKEYGLRRILSEIKNSPHVIILNYRDITGIGYRGYYDANILFQDAAWHMTSYPATVVRAEVFDGIDWIELFDRYFQEDRVSLSHIGLYFEALAKKNKIKAIHMPVGHEEISISSYRKKSMWNYATFMVWCEHWPNTVNALPDKYEKKNEVIRSLGVNTGIFSEDNFRKLRIEGFFDNNVFQKYEVSWQLFTDVSFETIKKISCMNPETAHISESCYEEDEWNQIRDFCDKFDHIYLYGCGFVASSVSKMLKKNGTHIKAYLVTDPSKEKKECEGIPVIKFDISFADDQSNGIIMAMNKNTILGMMDKPNAVWMKRDNCLTDWQRS